MRWAPVAAASLYAALLAARLPKIVEVSYFNADNASVPVIAELAPSTPGDIVLGNFAWYEALWLERATAWLPAHRTLWEVLPYALSAVVVALVAFTAWRALGAWAAALAAVIAGAMAPMTLDVLGSQAIGAKWLHTAIVGAALVAAAGRQRLAAGAVAVGAFTGLGAASDHLVYVAAVAPAVIAAVLVRERALLRATLLGAAVAVASGLAIGATARANGVVQAEFDVDPVSLGRLDDNLAVLWKALASLGNGDYFGKAFGASTAAHVVCAGLTAVALGACAWTGRKLWMALWAGYSSDSEEYPAHDRSEVSPALQVHVAFWAACAVALIGAFVFSSAPEDTFSARYLAGVLLAVAALLPLVARSGPRANVLVVIGATVFALTGVGSLARGEMTDNPGRYPGKTEARALATVVRADGLDHGYASYYSAAPLTFNSDFSARVYPVWECGPDGALCRFFLHRIDGWYVPKPRVKTFLVVDPAQPLVAGEHPELGPPLRVRAAGRLVVREYAYDIAERIEPGFTPARRP